MGYCIEQTESKFKILAKNIPSVVAEIKKLNDKPGYIGGFKDYSWVTRTDPSVNDISILMDDWRWCVDIDSNGDIDDITFGGEKLGDDVLFLNTIAPFVESESYITMSGEDNYLWRWIFKDGKMKEITPKVTWHE